MRPKADRYKRAARRRLAYHLRRQMRIWAAQPMRWGVDDCVLAQAAVEQAAFGRDPCAAFRGRYRTHGGARRVLGSGGLPAALRQAARRYGWRRIKPKHARIGDLGLVPTPTGLGLVRCLHRGEWIGRNEKGWSMVPTKMVKAAWSIC